MFSKKDLLAILLHCRMFLLLRTFYLVTYHTEFEDLSFGIDLNLLLFFMLQKCWKFMDLELKILCKNVGDTRVLLRSKVNI